jgi:hypothetical protein
MKFYNQPIIFFGLLLPALLTAAIVVTCFMGLDHVETTLRQKAEINRQLKLSRNGLMQVESSVLAERDHLERWKNLLAEESASSVTRHLKAIAGRLPEAEFQQTSFETPTGSVGFGAVSAQKSAQIRIGARGTYRSIQLALFELETRMPQLQLQEMRLSPNPNQPSLLNVQVSYTSWEN